MPAAPRPSPLPQRDGVGASCVALPPEPLWPTILDFLCQRFAAIPRATWLARIERGEVVDEHGRTVDASRAYAPRLRIHYYRAIEAEPEPPFAEEILFRDEQLLVADKPHFMPVTPTGRYVQQSLLVRLRRRTGIETLAPLHRIDRETAGLVLFSVAPAQRAAYSALFAERAVHKRYEAIVPWDGTRSLPAVRESRIEPDSHFMRMREAEGPPNALTRFELLEAKGGWARIGLQPSTGRRHQLRVHCEALGLPILNDAIYPRLLPEDAADPARPLQLLAQAIEFRDPVTGELRSFASQRMLALP